ncbi:MAG: hypothetical protein NTZ97_02765 [Candidatus Moranbacteria bacterium]|nr:hypothetical protein [Candidatus Moranbacteria bacterium]
MNKRYLKKLSLKNSEAKEIAITSLVILICLALFFLFPVKGFAQTATVIFVFFLLIPVLYIKFNLRRDFQDYGWQMGNWKKGVLWGILSLIATLAAVYLLIFYTNFSKAYTVPFSANFFYFALYEILLVGIYIFLYEMFFRGFIMFSFRKYLGILAPLLQFTVFALFLWATGNFNWINALYLITAFTSGWITYQSRSLLYAPIAAWLSIIIADAVIIHMYR